MDARGRLRLLRGRCNTCSELDPHTEEVVAAQAREVPYDLDGCNSTISRPEPCVAASDRSYILLFSQAPSCRSRPSAPEVDVTAP